MIINLLPLLDEGGFEITISLLREPVTTVAITLVLVLVLVKFVIIIMDILPG